MDRSKYNVYLIRAHALMDQLKAEGVEAWYDAQISAGQDWRVATADALEAMGLSISDAIRLLMLRVAEERRLPFDIKAPNPATREAMAELESGKGKSFISVEALMTDLNADD